MRVHCSLLQVFPLSLERAREATPSPSWPGPRGDALGTLFNDIIRRPHTPREPEIRWLIGALNIKLPEKEVPAEESGSDQEEEGSESEAGTEDEVLEDLHTGYLTGGFETFMLKPVLPGTFRFDG